MKNKARHLITRIREGSIAEELGLRPGDELISIDGRPVVDIIDYLFLTSEAYIEMEILREETQEIILFEIEKEIDEEVGLSFGNPLLDDAKRCSNQCLFCFVDQLPKGMRSSLYFKDDDSRLSFMQGNFVTLTNLNDEQLDRIIRYRISPINVSVHTTDPSLRCRILGNRHAGDILEKMTRLAQGHIEMNAQIVLMPGINDGEHLTRTITDLKALYPALNSVAIVPVGLSRYREGLHKLEPFDATTSRQTVAQVHGLQSECLEQLGTRFAFLSDEFYLQADLPVPGEEDYEGYVQIENGVGLLRRFERQLTQALSDRPKVPNPHVLLATGTLAAPWLKAFFARWGMDRVKVREIRNRFFGEGITVSGLVSATDLMEQIGADSGFSTLLIPTVMLKSDEPLFLDDMTVGEVSRKLGMNIIPVDVDGDELIDRLEELE